MIVNQGRSGLALLLGSVNVAEALPQYCAIGSGSAAVSVANTHMIFEVTRTAIGSRTTATANEVTFTTDFSSATMSGVALTEFAIFGSGAALGSANMWNREGFGSLVFDGTNDLQIVATFKVS